MKYIRYFWYVLKHKYYVFMACLKYGLIWQGIIHDWSKFLPDEAVPYANYFYNGDRRKDEFYTPTQGTYEFNMAWLKHQHRNPHHWQHYVLQEDSGEVFPVKIPDKYLKEMLCDWIGAGLAKSKDANVLAWYTLNRSKMVIHRESRDWIEQEIGYVNQS